MLRINRQTDYAIRLLLALARQGDQAMLSTSHIQQEMLIPRALSQRVVADLAKGGFLATYPGREGGLKLARPADDINLLQVVTHFEHNFIISECLREDGMCPFDQSCPVRCRWAHLQTLILRELEQTTIGDLARDSTAGTDVVPLVSEQIAM
jgi:Rrf2 family protein